MPRQRQQHADAAHLAQQTLHRCATHIDIPQLRLCSDAAAAWGCTMSLHVYPAPVHMLHPYPPREGPDMGWTSSMHVCCDMSTGHTGGVSPPPPPHPHTTAAVTEATPLQPCHAVLASHSTAQLHASTQNTSTHLTPPCTH